MEAREELISLTRKAKAASVVESFILDQWSIEPVEGKDAIEGEDEIIDPISGSVLVEGKESVEGAEPVIGEITSFRSAMIDMEDVINDELLTNIHIDDAADISFVVEFTYDSETEHRYTARPSLLNKAIGKSNGDKKSNGGNGGNGKSWKVNCWKEVKPETSNTKARLCYNLCQNAGVDVSDMPSYSKIDDGELLTLWHPVRVGLQSDGQSVRL